MASLKIILLFFCVSAAFGGSDWDDSESSLIDFDHCGQGQVAWCENFDTAIECNAVKHCVQSVWLTHNLPPSLVEPCESCKLKIEKFRQTLGSNVTKEITQELLENICLFSRITEIFRKRCERFVDHYVDRYFNELLDLLKSDIYSATVCHILRLCSNAELKVEGDVARFENIVLHLPSNFINVPESKKIMLGSARCIWGPSYWCNNVTSAKECSTISHCIQNVWSERKFEEDIDSVCQICKDMVEEARDVLESNKTQQTLKNVLQCSCKLILIKEIRTKCIKQANEYVPELIELLASKLKPTAICSVVGLCNNARVDSLLTLLPSSPAELPDSCTNCTVAFTAVERFFRNASKSQVRNQLTGVCDELSGHSKACHTLVAANFDRIYATLLREMRPFPVCHLSGMCAHQYHLHAFGNVDVAMRQKVDTMLATADRNLPCQLCQEFLVNVKNILTASTSEDEFREMLTGICRQTGSFADDCLRMVDDSSDIFYKFLTERLDPARLCSQINLCPKRNTIAGEGSTLTGSRETSTSVETVGTRVSLENPIDGELCETIVRVVRHEIDHSAYEHDVRKVLEHVCVLVAKNGEQKCDELVDAFGDVFVSILTNRTDANVVCSQLHRFELCPLCKYVMHLVQEKLEDPGEEKQVEEIVEKICHVVPASQKVKCDAFIEDYAQLIISILSEELDPNLVCPALNLCPTLTSPDQCCSQCQHLIADLTQRLGDDSSRYNVIDKLANLVPHGPSNSTLTALQLKVNHRDDLVDAMVAEFDAVESCVFLHFCDAQTVVEQHDDDDGHVVETNEGVTDEVVAAVAAANDVAEPYCDLCEMMVQLYENELTSNATEQVIERKLQKYCLKFTNAELRSNCLHFVREYVPEIARLLKKDVKPAAVCKVVHLCPQLPDRLSAGEVVSRCEFCAAVVGSFVDLATDPVRLHQSLYKLIQLCAVYDVKEQSQCTKVVTRVASMLEMNASPQIPSWFYCSRIRMCPYGAHLTTSSKACGDQSRWCVDAKTAVLCDKLAYCQRNVWKDDLPSP